MYMEHIYIYVHGDIPDTKIDRYKDTKINIAARATIITIHRLFHDEHVFFGCTATCSVLQCVAVCVCVAFRCSALQGVAECCSVLQCVAVCCSVLQCVASLLVIPWLFHGI